LGTICCNSFELSVKRVGFHKGTANCTKQKELMFQFQGIRSPNSLNVLCNSPEFIGKQGFCQLIQINNKEETALQ